MSCQRHHGIAVPAHYVAVDVLHAHTYFHRHESAHTGRIQDARLANDAVARQSGLLQGKIGHRVQRVGQDDVKRIRGIFQCFGSGCANDICVGAQQVIAAHTRFAWQACGDDDDVGVFSGSVIICPNDLYILTDDRHGLLHIQCLPLRHALHDVYQYNVGDFTLGQPVGCSGTGHTSPDDRDFFCHFSSKFFV